MDFLNPRSRSRSRDKDLLLAFREDKITAFFLASVDVNKVQEDHTENSAVLIETDLVNIVFSQTLSRNRHVQSEKERKRHIIIVT